MPSPMYEPLLILQRRVLSPLTSGLALDERTARVLFREPPRGTIADRWHIYAHGYFARLSEALENDYTALRRIVGRDAFDSMVRRYALAQPPRSHDLGRAGDRLSRFLENDSLSRKLRFSPIWRGWSGGLPKHSSPRTPALFDGTTCAPWTRRASRKCR